VTRPNLVAAELLPEGPFDVPVDRAGLVMPRLRVLPQDGDPWEVQAYNPDLVLWEETAAIHRWKAATPAAAPMKWLTFLAWAASRRTGVTDLGWDEFLASTLQVSDVSQPGDTASPTGPGPGPG